MYLDPNMHVVLPFHDVYFVSYSQEVRRLVSEACEKTETLLSQNTDRLKTVTQCNFMSNVTYPLFWSS